MTSPIQNLDIHQFPLFGQRLIEASAGTGKTYALAQLYLRYLLECEFEPSQILVVTFTKAATQELRARIRQRIQSLRRLFEAQRDAVAVAMHEDQDLQHLYERCLARAHSTAERAALAERLRVHLCLAERQMDQAEIHTIHGFCQQLMQQYPLEFALPMQHSLLEDVAELLRQTVQDFWRREVLVLPDSALQFIRAQWAEPEHLLGALSPLFARRPERLLPEVDADLSAWTQTLNQQAIAQKALKQAILRDWAEVRTLIAQSDLQRVSNKLDWWHEVRTWSLNEAFSTRFPRTNSIPNVLLRFLPQALPAETKKNGQVPSHPLFSTLEAYFSAYQDIALAEQFLVLAYRRVSVLFEETKRAQKVFDFNDQIRRVDVGLQAQAKEGLLRAQLRNTYRVALIDEFQDTDPAQYRIFSTLFAVDEHAKDPSNAGALVMIGDPKQAIYGFRGGDIATYLRARRDVLAVVQGGIYSMAHNWRSRPTMVAAVNHLFGRKHAPFFQSEIPFLPVQAARAEPEVALGAALQFVQWPASGNKMELMQGLGDWCLQEIRQLLSEQGVAQHEIAILVRSSAEADFLKQRFATAGIALCFEGKQSIYQSDEAQALLHLLEAAAAPGNLAALRLSLADRLWGFPDALLLAMEQQAELSNHFLELFARLHDTWGRHGVLRMLRQALRELQVLSTWRAQLFAADMDRRLTNLNQLAELLQAQTRRYRSHAELLRWFTRQIDRHQRGVAANDETRLRLESDAQLIQVQTIHKSKGLEYAHVFIPFAFATRLTRECWFYDAQGRRGLDLLRQAENHALAEQERLAEEMRLLYVALTRARLSCRVGLSAYQSSQALSAGLVHTALAHLLFPQGVPPKLDDALLREHLSELAAESKGCISTRFLSGEENFACGGMLSDGDEVVCTWQPQALKRPLHTGPYWRIHSFTGLINESGHAHATQRDARFFSPSEVAAMHWGTGPAAPSLSTQKIDIQHFPRGARAGTFLHTLFERISFADMQLRQPWRGQYASLSQMIERTLRQAKLVEAATVGAWANYLLEWLSQALARPLYQDLVLASLGEGDYLSEMAFHFSVKACEEKRLNDVLRRHLPGHQNLAFADFSGHLKGAVDLVLRHRGQYFILDYKSNYLGEQAQDYAPEALAECMRSHRYDLQYLLYCLALHRHLRARMGEDYRYERDFGGVTYVFLRALVADEAPGQGVYFARPSFRLIEQLDALF